MKVMCQISFGEFIDKITILTIKLKRIDDPKKLFHIKEELDKLKKTYNGECDVLLNELIQVNEKLWIVEDLLRFMEKYKLFNNKFIGLARSVYRLNDKRFEIKNNINKKFDSEFMEQKSYEDY